MANVNAKLLEGIAYFEKMLKVMPGDRTTLEFLSVAYEQLGDEERTRAALIQLAATLLKEKDLTAADSIAERLKAYEQDDAQEMVRHIRTAHSPVILKAVVRPGRTPAAPSPSGGAAADPSASTMSLPPDGPTVAQTVLAAVKAEAALVRVLSEANIVDPSAAEIVQKYLGGLPEPTRPFLVSALAILEKECGSVGQRAAIYMADAVSAPPVALGAFAPGSDLIRKLPETVVRVRGAIPFGALGDTLLVALLNPMDMAFRAEVEQMAGRPCRFFLADPHTTEDYLEKLFSIGEK